MIIFWRARLYRHRAMANIRSACAAGVHIKLSDTGIVPEKVRVQNFQFGLVYIKAGTLQLCALSFTLLISEMVLMKCGSSESRV